MAAVEAGLRVVGTSVGSGFDDVLAIEKTLTPQVVIALCGPLGTPLHEVAESFKELLLSTDYGYEYVEIIRLSDEIRNHKGIGPESSTKELIEAGNELRRDHGNEVLARLAVRRISVARAAEQAKATAAKKSRTSGPV
ncbi:hypothetical protein [Pseudomonas farris]